MAAEVTRRQLEREDTALQHKRYICYLHWVSTHDMILLEYSLIVLGVG